MICPFANGNTRLCELTVDAKKPRTKRASSLIAGDATHRRISGPQVRLEKDVQGNDNPQLAPPADGRRGGGAHAAGPDRCRRWIGDSGGILPPRPSGRD